MGIRFWIVLGLLAAMTAGAGGLDRAREVETFCPDIIITSETDKPLRRPGRLSLAEALDVHFHVALDPDLSGDHLLELEVFTPNGHLYQVLTSPITTDQGREGADVRVDGYPKPLTAQLLRRSEGTQHAMLVMPAAGTTISSGSLYGRWTVVPRLDGREMTCERIFGFTLTE